MKRLLVALLAVGVLAGLGFVFLGPSSREPVQRVEAPEPKPAKTAPVPTESVRAEAEPAKPSPKPLSRGPVIPGSDEAKARPYALRLNEEAPSLSGLEVETLGAADRERLKVPDEYGNGVLIQNLHPDAPAAVAGLRKGDVIVRAMRENVDEPGDLTRVVNTRDHSVVIAVRNGEYMQLVLQPPFVPEPKAQN